MTKPKHRDVPALKPLGHPAHKEGGAGILFNQPDNILRRGADVKNIGMEPGPGAGFQTVPVKLGAVAQQDELFLPEGFQGHRLVQPGQRIVPVDHQHQLIGEDVPVIPLFQFLLPHPPDGPVALVVPDPLGDLAVVKLLEHHLQPGIFLGEGGAPLRHSVIAQNGQDRNVQPPALLPQLEQLPVLFQQLPGKGQGLGALGSQPHLPAGPVKERITQVPFQQGDLLGDGGLGGKQLLRRPGKAFSLPYLQKVFQSLNLHPLLPFTIPLCEYIVP